MKKFFMLLFLMFALIAGAMALTATSTVPNNVLATGPQTVLEIWITGWASASTAATVSFGDAAVLGAITPALAKYSMTFTTGTIATWVPQKVFSAYTNLALTHTYGMFFTSGVVVDSTGNTPIVTINYKNGQ